MKTYKIFHFKKKLTSNTKQFNKLTSTDLSNKFELLKERQPLTAHCQ
jgi:hypothetical protein